MLSCFSDKGSIHSYHNKMSTNKEEQTLKRSAEESEDDRSSTGGMAESISKANKKQKIDSDKVSDASNPAMLKEGSEFDSRVANVPLFESSMQFPNQLWELLKYDELKKAIWWLPGDDAFAINEIVFSELLLESHFRGNKFTSIVRKLNRWGFRKHVDRSLPQKTVAFYHRSFQKNRQDLIQFIEKEEGKPVLPIAGEHSHFSLFPEATTSRSILAQVLQPNQPPPGLSRSTGLRTVDPSTAAAFGAPSNHRQHSTILQSIFGQRGTVNFPTGPLAGGLASSPGLTAPSLGPSPTSQSRELLRRSALDFPLQQRGPTTAIDPTTDRHALLASMVSNIERERQQQLEGRLLQARERRRTLSTAEEQKQETDDANLLSLISGSRRQSLLEMQRQQQRRQLLEQELLESRTAQEQNQEFPTHVARDDGSSLSSAMSSGHHRSFLDIQQQQQQQLEIAACEEALQSTRLLAAERQQRERAELSTQLQLHRQLHAAMASPNPLLARPLHQGGLGRRIMGQETLSLPADLLLSPHQQRIRQQVLQLQQQQQMEDSLQRYPSTSSGNHPR